jgi:ribokinase
MTPPDLIGLGMASLDILVRAPEPGAWHMGIPLDGLTIEGGGMACNAMVAAQRLGAATAFIGTFGSDRLGQLKLQALQESGVDTRLVIRREGPDDQVVLVHVNSATGERSFYPLAAPGRRLIQTAELDQAALVQARYLLVDTTHPAAALQAARWMHTAGKQVMLDANAHHGPPAAEVHQLVRETDFLVCSSGFLQALTGQSGLEQAAAQALALGLRVVVQTEGAQGSHTFTRQESFHTPAVPIAVVDTTGAGDAFHGAFLVGLLRGWDLPEIARFSSAAGALACRALGRSRFPTIDEVYALMGKGI